MPIRRRLIATLFGGAALGSTGYIASATVSSLAVDEIMGQSTLAGLPNAVAILGTAVGTSVLTGQIAAHGRRPGLMVGYALGVVGAVAAVAAVAAGSLPFLLAGMALLGMGNASNHLARYAGAELYPPEQRASGLSLIVWAGTVGSVLGPTLLQPGGAVALSRRLPEVTGGYLITAVFLSLALLLYYVALRPDPATLAHEIQSPDPAASLGDAFRLAHVKRALTALITGQVVMVLIMTATPLHIHHGGSNLGTIGLVMSAHTLGMFAFSPVTGRLADRFGRDRVLVAGIFVLAVSAILAAVARPGSTPQLVLALFLLGVGWNLGFVAGSALLTVGFPASLRVRVQGRADSITWVSSATASLGSGILFELADYRWLSLAGLALLVVPAWILLNNRERVVAA